MSSRPNLDKRREDFLTYLCGLGVGDECVYVPWLTPYNRNGKPDYAILMIEWHKIRAHRWVYQQVIGPVPPGKEVCHSCDNPPCVRPSHLWAGTTSQNALDAFQKGRRVSGPGMRGENHGMAKLTDAEVREIRKRLAAGSKQREVATAFGVSQAHVSKIARREIRAT